MQSGKKNHPAIGFHVNRNALHTYRHTNAVNFRNEAYRLKQEHFENQAIRKKNQTDSFIERYLRSFSYREVEYWD